MHWWDIRDVDGMKAHLLMFRGVVDGAVWSRNLDAWVQANGKVEPTQIIFDSTVTALGVRFQHQVSPHHR